MTPYLILHKVRGEPVFDIAIKLCLSAPCQANCGLWDGERCEAHDEEWWIIPTSGHRAYPYWFREVDDIFFDADIDAGGCVGKPIGFVIPPMPEGIPDHYHQSSKVDKAPSLLDSVMAVLGRAREPLKRRV